MNAVPVRKLTAAEYLALDREAEHKSEFHDGEIFPVVAASWEHSQIVIQMGWRLAERLAGTPCRAGSAVRVRVTPTKYVYPDIAVICGKAALTDETRDTLTNPKVIVEVLSPSTEDYDRGGKFVLYRGLPSFEEYVLVAQDAPRIEVFHRTPEGNWLLRIFDGLDAEVRLESLGISIPLSEIYSGIL
ncbi:MAG: Uma2 family endonuclease [Acidobacteria bacterium]|nr:Uma2 family endonuclease [Acidobacteriota bacterium]